MSGRQICKLLALIVLSYWISHLSIYLVGDNFRIAVSELSGILIYIIAIICAMSFAMFTYVDNTAKDLTDLRNDVSREKYKVVQSKLSNFKFEIIANAAAIIVFFGVEYIIRTMVEHVFLGGVVKNAWLIETVGVSLRFSCFAVIVFAASSQILGLLIAVEFREQIANNRK